MFTLVIVAFVSLLALTAFVPKAREWVQWLFKKSALVVNFAVIGFIFTVFELLLWVALVIMGLIQCTGRLLVFIGNWALDKLSAIEDKNVHTSKRKFANAIKRFS